MTSHVVTVVASRVVIVVASRVVIVATSHVAIVVASHVVIGVASHVVIGVAFGCIMWRPGGVDGVVVVAASECEQGRVRLSPPCVTYCAMLWSVQKDSGALFALSVGRSRKWSHSITMWPDGE